MAGTGLITRRRLAGLMGTLLVPFSFGSGAAQEQAKGPTGRWVPRGGPPGPGIDRIAGSALEPSRVFLTSDGAGLYVSENGGEMWRPIAQPELADAITVSISPTDPADILVGTWTNGVLRSRDGGTNWEKPGQQAFHTGWDFYRPSTGQIWVATNEGVFLSTDDGQSWTPKSAGLSTKYIRCLSGLGEDSPVLYCGSFWGSQGFIYRSEDSGETWSVDYRSDGPLYINRLAVDADRFVYAATTQGVFVKGPSSSSWSQPRLPADRESGASRNILDIDVSGGERLVTSGASVMRLDSKAMTATVDESYELPRCVTSVANGRGITRYVGTWTGVWIGQGGERQFSRQGLPQFGEVANNTLWADAKRGLLLAGTYGGGCYRSTDRGQTWQPIIDARMAGGSRMNGGTVVMDTGVYLLAFDGLGLLRSEDEGKTWTDSNQGLAGREVLNLKIGLQGDLYLASGEGGYRSLDGGKSWQHVTGSFGVQNIKDFAIDPRDGRRILCVTDGAGLYESADGGESWKAHPDAIPTKRLFRIRFDPRHPQSVLIGTIDAGVFSSSDGGTAWQADNDGIDIPMGKAWDGAVRAIVFTERNFYVGLYRGGVYMRGRENNRWQSISADLPSQAVGGMVPGVWERPSVVLGTGNGVYEWFEDAP